MSRRKINFDGKMDTVIHQLDTCLADHKAFSAKSRQTFIRTSIFTLLMMALGLFMAHRASIRLDELNYQMHTNIAESKQVQENIDRRMAYKNTVSTTIGLLRASLEIGQRSCGQSEFDYDKYQKQFLGAKYQLLADRLNIPAKSSPQLLGELTKLEKTVFNIRSICDANLPSDKVFQENQHKIGDIIINDINKLRTYKRKLLILPERIYYVSRLWSNCGEDCYNVGRV